MKILTNKNESATFWEPSSTVLWCNRMYKWLCTFRPDDIHTILAEKSYTVKTSNKQYSINEIVIGSTYISKMIEALIESQSPMLKNTIQVQKNIPDSKK